MESEKLTFKERLQRAVPGVNILQVDMYRSRPPHMGWLVVLTDKGNVLRELRMIIPTSYVPEGQTMLDVVIDCVKEYQ